MRIDRARGPIMILVSFGSDDLRQRLASYSKGQAVPYSDDFVDFEHEVGTDFTDAKSPTNRSANNFNNHRLGRAVPTP